MACYAPLLVNANDWRWKPDVTVLNSWQQYGTPSYWVQQFFTESSGAIVLNTILQSDSLEASAILWETEGRKYLKIKMVNIGESQVTLKIFVDGLAITLSGSMKTVLTSAERMDENTFQQLERVVPVKSNLVKEGKEMCFTLSPHSFTSFDLLVKG